MRYTPEKKSMALARVAEVGVKMASEELGISLQTLYKWRNDNAGENASNEPLLVDANADELRQMLVNDEFLESKVKQLEDQNAALRDENKMLQEKSAQLKKAIIALMG